jgi:hypothetical protein
MPPCCEDASRPTASIRRRLVGRSIEGMWLRRGFFGWLIPAAFLLPLWLLVGWGVFNAGGWAFVWVLFLAIPSVFIGELVLTLLVRARGTVRAQRAVSWWDVLGFTVWHCLTIALGFYNPEWWAPVFILTIAVFVGLFWLVLWELWREARPAGIVQYTRAGVGFIPAERPAATAGEAAAEPDVIIITEARKPTAS